MKVIVGMSGGVDSSVAAILLMQQGYEVEGMFMRNWDSTINNDVLGNPDVETDICPQEKDYNDALSVCNKLGIKLHRVDFVKEYWDNVFTYFLEELKRGRTPNPDVMCNKYIKFDAFLKKAIEIGCDYIATGHYAKLVDGKLVKAVDTNKDQSYFLSYLTSNQLSKVLFPLGEYVKEDIRKIAHEYDLITAEKKDSTGICFIGERNFSEFLKNYLPNKKGKIINIENNEELGNHIGLMHYTIGQRKNLGIGGYSDALYVCGKNIENNILYVASTNNMEYLNSTSCIIENINDICIGDIKKCNAKFRYRQQDIEVEIKKLDNNEIEVSYTNVASVTPGQICVLYNKDIVIGAGIIKECRKNNEKLWYLM